MRIFIEIDVLNVSEYLKKIHVKMPTAGDKNKKNISIIKCKRQFKAFYNVKFSNKLTCGHRTEFRKRFSDH